jgi:Asp-tRNA(Asn)/Glu-tRNA(Gln) amidotransferase A subunit family amidase
MARSVADAALVAGVLAGHDPADPDSAALPVPALLAAALAEPPSMPRLAFVKGPTWEKASPDTQAGFARLAAALGDVVREETLSAEFAAAPAAAFTISRVGIARNYRPYLERGRDQLSAFMQGAIEEGSRITAVDFLAARVLQETLYARLVPIFDRYDAIVTPAAPGEAPGPETTGDAAFNGIWTLCQVPAITLPLLKGAAGLPIGVQVVSRRGDDARLLRTARWLMETAAKKA